MPLSSLKNNNSGTSPFNVHKCMYRGQGAGRWANLSSGALPSVHAPLMLANRGRRHISGPPATCCLAVLPGPGHSSRGKTESPWAHGVSLACCHAGRAANTTRHIPYGWYMRSSMSALSMPAQSQSSIKPAQCRLPCHCSDRPKCAAQTLHSTSTAATLHALPPTLGGPRGSAPCPRQVNG